MGPDISLLFRPRSLDPDVAARASVVASMASAAMPQGGVRSSVTHASSTPATSAPAPSTPPPPPCTKHPWIRCSHSRLGDEKRCYTKVAEVRSSYIKSTISLYIYFAYGHSY